jgi:hypothetical protein
MESLRRPGRSGKGSFISRRAAGRPVLNKSRSEAILPACLRPADLCGQLPAQGYACFKASSTSDEAPYWRVAGCFTR